MELREIRLILGRHLGVMLVAFLGIVGIGLVAAYAPEQVYRTSTTLVLNIKTVSEGGGTIQQVGFQLPALTQIAESQLLRERAAERVPEELRARPARIEALADVSVLQIRARSQSPEVAQAWANAVALELIEERADDPLVELVQLDPARLPREAIEPRRPPILVAAVVLGVIAAVFAALAADRIKKAFDSNRAVRERLGTTVLGEIPMLRRRERRIPMAKLLQDRDASPDVASAFEALRTNLEFLVGDGSVDRVAFVSQHRQTGKSTICAGVACTFARVGKSVVAVEADLHHPTLSDQLMAPPGYGLGDIAASDSSEIVLQPTPYPGLDVLCAGIPVGRVADVIATTLPGVLATLRRRSSFVVIDSPPLRGAPESPLIVAEAHHIILVVNSRSSDLGSLSDSVDRITESGGVLLGIVFNRVPRRRLRKDAYPTTRRRHSSVDEPVDAPPRTEPTLIADNDWLETPTASVRPTETGPASR
jgi:Mrp family chromosome partitioning ATPase/capsular polysaccharide biosynthesis protein